MRLKVAVTKGTLRVPPTYFALAHAEHMADVHEFEMFCLVADVRAATSIPIHDFVPLQQLGFRRREIVMPAFIPRMVRGVSRFRPDVIHQHFGTWAVPATRASRSSSVPLVTTLHGADVFAYGLQPSTAMARWHHHNIRLASEQSSKLLAVSEFLAGQAVAAGLPSRKLEVHYQGIDTDYFTPSETDDRSQAGEEPVLLFVGGLSERKGIRDLVQASRAAQSRTPHRMVVAGEGELSGQIREAVGSDPRVRFVGSQDRAAIRELIQNARALVVPSRTHNGWREAAGLVALEAAACGTPVIASDCGGLSEMVVDGVTGTLVEEGNVAALTVSIQDMLELSPLEYGTMCSAARRFAVEERSLDRSCAELAGHYDDVV